MFAGAGALSGTPLAPRPACRGTLGRNETNAPAKARTTVRPLRHTVHNAVEEPRRSVTENDDNDLEPTNWESVCTDPVCSTRLVVNGQDLPAFEDVSTAHFRIRNGVVRTPLVRSRQLSAVTGCNIFLKHEWQQATGSFKERGARNSLLALDDEQRARGVVAASAGNHALALAYHGAELGIPVTVLMPSIAPLTKITKCRALGARVILEGDSIADAALAAQQYVNDEGMKYINGFDDFNIIAGAGSVGLEILEDAENIDAIVIPVGGGGLIAGISLAVKTINPDVQIIGVEPNRCASMAAAMEAGEVVKVTMPGPTLADGLAVPTVGPRSFEVCRNRVDKLVTVSEKDISVALLRLVELEKLIQEGAGAAGIAAVLAGKLPELKGKNVAVLLCGGNIDTSTLGNVLERGLVNDGRLIRFSCVVPDRPGGIAGLCATIAFVGASIKQINHERAWLQDDSHSVQVDVTCELTGPQMAEKLYEALAEKYPVDFTRPKSVLSGERASKQAEAFSGVNMPAGNASNGAPPSPATTNSPKKLPAPILYDYDTIVNNVKPSAALVGAVEDAFAQLANGKVDVPMPMHIGVAETATAGPGDCHIKGGYIEGAPTWTVKLACVSFYKNVEKGLPAGSGVFVVCDATNGAPKAVLHENRYLTDLRTGAAGAVAVKHLAVKGAKSVAFIGTGVIAEAMARATATVFGFEEAFAYSPSPKKSSNFCKKMSDELGFPHYACATAEDAVRAADVVFTQTPGGEWVVEEEWLRPHALIICSGSDQPTKNEIPPQILANSKVVTDITNQCARVGEVRSAIEAGVMTTDDVHAEIGEIISGKKTGREGNERIVCDLTGTGAQDAAIGSHVMDALRGVTPGSANSIDTSKPRLPAPKLYDYDTIVNNVSPSKALTEAVENAFAQLAGGKVDVPMPMHIGVAETATAGPGDCHIKGGYIEGAPTWTVKLACVSFYKNVEKGLPAGSGVFVVCDATNGAPKAVLHENRYLTDLRTGAAGAVAVKHLAVKGAKSVAFIGTGVIAESMARSTATVFDFKEAYAYSRDVSKASTFCDKMSAELGYEFNACASAEDAVRAADVVFTQTPGGEWVLEEQWLRPHALIVCSGSDQPTKNEIPPNVLKKAKVVTDITAQCARVGEVRSAIAAGVMTEQDVHAELGQIVSGQVKGRKGKELIVCDLTGTGAQDAAIGSYVMDVLD